MTLLKKIQMEKNHIEKYQSSFTRYKRWQNYCIAQPPKKRLCFYCRILLVALHIALICSTTALIRCGDVTRDLSQGKT